VFAPARGFGRVRLKTEYPGFALVPGRGVRGYVDMARSVSFRDMGRDVGATNSFRIYQIFINF
jgi:hypothetical protein